MPSVDLASTLGEKPPYWETATTALMARDRILKKQILAHPSHLPACKDSPFITLMRAIVGQQISVKTAQTIWQKLQNSLPKLTPCDILAASTTSLTACGLPQKKVLYLQDLATYFQKNLLRVETWPLLEDEAIIEDLTQVRGIGRWTAEMFLIFHLLRPNVFPLDDRALLQSISINYFSKEPVSRNLARELAENWKPWRTVATWYLWRSMESSATKSL